MERHILLFQNLKMIKDYWANHVKQCLNPSQKLSWSENEFEFRLIQSKLTTTEEQEAFLKIQDETIRGVIHSILVMLDGGDALADHMQLDLIDLDNQTSLKNECALDEEFIGYLKDKESW